MKKFAKRMAALLLAVSMLAGLVVHAEVADTDVAKIGDTGYATFDAALAAVADGQTITLLKDATLGSKVEVKNKSVTVNVNGNTLTFSTVQGAVFDAANVVFNGGGTVVANAENAIYLNNAYVEFSGVSVNVANVANKSVFCGNKAANDTVCFNGATVAVDTTNASSVGTFTTLTMELKNNTNFQFSAIGTQKSTRMLVSGVLSVDNSTLKIVKSDYALYKSSMYVRNNATVEATYSTNFTKKNPGTLYVDGTSTLSVDNKGTLQTVDGTLYYAEGATCNVSDTTVKTKVAVETLNANGKIAGLYTSIADAKAASTGTYKVVGADALAGVALDLAGETWIIDEYTAASASEKITDTVGGGVLKCKEMTLYGDNGGYMPLYNAQAGGYNLYGYSITIVDDDNEKIGDARRFWYCVGFTNPAAYDLVIAGTSKLTFGADVICGNANLDVTFSDSTSADSFAAGWAAAAKGNSDVWMYVDVKGLDDLTGKTLELTPTLEISGQDLISGGTIEYTVK